MKYRVLSLTLMLCLLLTACGGGGDAQSQASLPPEPAADMETLLVVDGREVPAWRYLYWLERVCESIAADYAAAGAEPDWQAGEPTLGEYAKQQALSDTVLYATVENWAEQYGCTLPEESSADDRAEELAAVGQMYGKLYTLFCTEGSALAPAAEETAAFAEEAGWYTFERLLIPAGGDAEAARGKAAEVFACLNAAADKAAEFDSLSAEYGSGAQTAQKGDGTLPAALENALSTLAEGQFSGILESPEGFSILRRLPPDPAALREAHFDHLLQNAAESAQVQCTAEYGKIDAAAVCAGLQTAK